MIKRFVKHQLEIINDEPWFGDSLRSKIDPLTNEEAFIKPLPAIHSVAELISHSTEWKKEGIRQLQGSMPTLTEASADNWKSNEELKKTGWNKLKEEFYYSVNNLIKILQTKDDAFLEEMSTDKRYTFSYLIEGLLDHDVYHLGQIGITIKLIKGR